MTQFNETLHSVTVSGADDNTSIEQMIDLSNKWKYQTIEFAILLMDGPSKERYPSMDWIKRLYDAHSENKNMLVSGHICGKWAREICDGNWNNVLNQFGEMFHMFNRVQLNFSPYVADTNIVKFLDGMNHLDILFLKQIIFQLKNINDPIFIAAKNEDYDVVPLFDISGGRGISPTSWPISDCLCGYAGGLSPDNVESQIKLIRKVASHFWIDAETGLRTNGEFDLTKVEQFIDLAYACAYPNKE